MLCFLLVFSTPFLRFALCVIQKRRGRVKAIAQYIKSKCTQSSSKEITTVPNFSASSIFAACVALNMCFTTAEMSLPSILSQLSVDKNCEVENKRFYEKLTQFQSEFNTKVGAGNNPESGLIHPEASLEDELYLFVYVFSLLCISSAR